MMEIKVKISEGTKNYPIIIEEGIRGRIGELLTDYYRGDKILIVTDENLRGLYCPAIVQELKKAGYHPELYVVPAGEEAKTLKYLQTGYEALIGNGFNRDNLIVALGGGVVGDLAGFLAATYLRGIPFIQIPTTLLAQVDSSVGGKTAVNHPSGKNLIGAFYQPELVVIDPGFLTTLPVREMRTGMAEVIKSGLIADRDFVMFLLEKYEEISSLKREELSRVISTSCKIKAHIVGKDEKETGTRALLNYGHTIAHALETITDYKRYTHGEAVALGMVAAGEIAVRLGLLAGESQRLLIELIELYGLPVRGGGEASEQVYRALFRDKKIRENRLHWILLKGIGRPLIRDDVDNRIVKAVLEGLSR